MGGGGGRDYGYEEGWRLRGRGRIGGGSADTHNSNFSQTFQKETNERINKTIM
jgi:hypothetical protein